MQRSVLIVDDIKTNRLILRKIIEDDYNIIEAESETEAQKVVRQKYNAVSAVFLNLDMPNDEGVSLLTLMRQNPVMATIPVIVTFERYDENAEIKALKHGANDYIAMPYNKTIVLQRIKNVINLRERSAIFNILQRDKLTGLYNRESFFNKVQELTRKHSPGYYVMSNINIDHFKVINENYGISGGDAVLSYIADTLNGSFLDYGGICSRITADDFAILYPASLINSPTLERCRRAISYPSCLTKQISFSTGRYIVTDTSLSANAMYDRAVLAAASVKARYDKRIAVFDQAMLDNVFIEQQISNEMKQALEMGEFECWLQPQYNHSNGTLVGAEALARWIHPQKGMISPEVFIPIFEKNGFVYELDKYIWRTACEYIRSWLDEGLSPVPISVNVSRYDLLCDDFFSVLTSLVNEYDIPVKLLRLEITETAFSKSTQRIIDMVKKLMSFGFIIEIDDFGNGYSSLNTLKNVPASILKLDMRFLQGDIHSSRGGSIMESIIRMAKWLNMPVIAEGVETREQADYLLSIGCFYIQGYLYARPMPMKEFDELAKKIETSGKREYLDVTDELEDNTLWSPDSIDTLIFNRYIGGACIFEYSDGNTEVLRINEKYAKAIGGNAFLMEDALKTPLYDYLNDDNKLIMDAGIKKAVESYGESVCELFASGLPGEFGEAYIRLTIRAIAKSGKHALLYVLVENVTEQRKTKIKERVAAAQLKAMLETVDGGIIMTDDGGEKAKVIFANDIFYRQLGLTPEQYDDLPHDEVYHPDDRERVISEIGALSALRQSGCVVYRIARPNGEIRFMRSNISFIDLPGSDSAVRLSVIYDVTDRFDKGDAASPLTIAENGRTLDSLTNAEIIKDETLQIELLNNLPCGAALLDITDDNVTTAHINRRFMEFTGHKSDILIDKSTIDLIHPNDADGVLHEYRLSLSEKRDMDTDIRIMCDDGQYRSFHMIGRYVENQNGKRYIYACLTPIDSSMFTMRYILPYILTAIMESTTDIAFAKDRDMRYISSSKAFVKMTGRQNESEVIGKTDYDLFPKETADKFRVGDEQLIKSGRSIIDVIDRLPDSEGVSRFIRSSKYILKDTVGNVIGIYGVARDITEYKTAFEHLKLINDSMPAGLATCAYENGNFRVTYYNDGYCSILGFNRDDFKNKASVIPMGKAFKEDIPMLHRKFSELIKSGEPLECTYRIHMSDGGYKWIKHTGAIADRKGDSFTINAVIFDVTKEKEAAERLRLSEEQYRLAVNHSGKLVYRYTVSSRCVSISNEAAEAFGDYVKLDDIPNSLIDGGFIAPESVPAIKMFYSRIEAGDKTGVAPICRKVKNGSFRWFEYRFSTIFSADMKPTMAIILIEDINQRLEKEAVYAKWRQSLLNKKAEDYTLFICNLSKGAYVDKTDGGLLRIKFSPEADTFNKRTMEYVRQYVYTEDWEQYIATLNQDTLLANYYRGERSYTFEYRELIQNGDIRWLRLTIELVEYPNSKDICVYLMYENIDSKKRRELLTQQRARTDSLTGVLNRSAFIARVEEATAKAKPDSLSALLMIDIDDFRRVNNCFGHAAGDKLLVDLAGALKTAIGREDALGRIGGDEFIMLLTNCPDKAYIDSRAQRIREASASTLNMQVPLSVSIGIALFPADGKNFETLYGKADAALFSVKNSGKKSYAFYNDGMIEHTEDGIMTSVNENDGRTRRLLIVDDNIMDLYLLSGMFKDEYIIEKAMGGNSALMWLRYYGTDISAVLLDLMMPDMDGFTVLERMRADARMRLIPAIVVSSDEDRESCMRAIRCGASDFITKPVDPELLRIRVQSAISRSENERLRAENSLLESYKNESAKLRALLKGTKTVLIEYNSVKDEFYYDPTITRFVAGDWNQRSLWEILEKDGVAREEDVRELRDLAYEVLENDEKSDGETTIKLNTPAGQKHSFCVRIYRLPEESNSADNIIITLNDRNAGDE